MALALAAHDHKMPTTLKTSSKPTRKTPMTDTDTSTPTQALYNTLQQAFDHFNRDLFEGQLPHCMITLRSASKTHGYHHSERFVSATGEVIDEIGIHPGYFTLESVEMVLSTLVHEMVHHWQQHFGTPARMNNHNREWADKMLDVGLQASSTGLPGGKQTGRSMSDYILPDGKFLASCKKLIETGFSLPWMDRHAPMPPQAATARHQALADAGVEIPMSKPPASQMPESIGERPTIFEPPPPREKTRFRFKCPTCSVSAWASAETSIVCGECMEPMEMLE
jgi:predicted SprT family Zn-dependent metalloprotease